jgi:hypothetical protein
MRIVIVQHFRLLGLYIKDARIPMKIGLKGQFGCTLETWDRAWQHLGSRAYQHRLDHSSVRANSGVQHTAELLFHLGLGF